MITTKLQRPLHATTCPVTPSIKQQCHLLHHKQVNLQRVAAGKRNFGEKLGAELLDVVTGEQLRSSAARTADASAVQLQRRQRHCWRGVCSDKLDYSLTTWIHLCETLEKQVPRLPHTDNAQQREAAQQASVLVNWCKASSQSFSCCILCSCAAVMLQVFCCT